MRQVAYADAFGGVMCPWCVNRAAGNADTLAYARTRKLVPLLSVAEDMPCRDCGRVFPAPRGPWRQSTGTELMARAMTEEGEEDDSW